MGISVEFLAACCEGLCAASSRAEAQDNPDLALRNWSEFKNWNVGLIR